jgi:myo-inositol-1-phosphate synthase
MSAQSPIKVAIVGVGNCASSLIQGIVYYSDEVKLESAKGLMHPVAGGYKPSDIEIVAAYDIDKRKIGQTIDKAIFAKPNCTTVFCADMPTIETVVQMGVLLDGCADQMADYPENQAFRVADAAQPTKEDVVANLIKTGAQVLMNYLPVGSQKATEFYAECALEAGVAFVNNIPVFIASDPVWAKRFADKNIPIIGDDIKAQVGATITHRTLVDLFQMRGVDIKRTYQLNTGGNTDFLNMLDSKRLASKKISKTEAVTSVVHHDMGDDNVHVGPSDYVPWQKDNKLCFLRIEGELFGGVPMNIECRLSVEDSPNSAGVAIDSIRCARLALDRGIGGVIVGPSAYFCKHPPIQFADKIAHTMTNDFIEGSADHKQEFSDFLAAAQNKEPVEA